MIRQKINLALHSFRWRLTLWFGALSLVILLISSLYIGRIATNELTALGGETLYASAKSAADLLSLGLREREKDIHLLSVVPNLRRDDLSGDEIRTLLEIRKETYDAFAWLGVINTQGIVLQATDNRLVGNDVSQRRWFRATANRPASATFHATMLLAPLLPDQVLNEPARLVDFAAPIFGDDNRVRGVLSSHLLWNWVTETVASAISSDIKLRGVEILIADQSGNILYPHLFASTFNPPPDWEQDEHYKMMDWGDGRHYLTSQVPVKMTENSQSGWRIITRQHVDQAHTPAHDLQQRLFLLRGLTVLFFLIAIYYASSRMSRPIEQLARAVRHVGQHERKLDFPDTHKIVEIEQLCDSIRTATSSLLDKELELEALNASLEEQVTNRTSDLVRLNEELERLATTDGLTKVNNRRSFDEKLRENFLFVRRQKAEFSLLLIDIDFFKKVNDVHGHQAGDHVLQQLAQILKDNVRATDFVARYGGEEFAIVLPNIKDRREGYLVAEKIRRAVYSVEFPPVGRVTISVGVSYPHKDDQTEQAVLERADKALYMAKEAGRNRVVSLSGQSDAKQSDYRLNNAQTA